MKPMCILALEYLESDYQQTRMCLDEVSGDYDIIYVDRKGKGSMSHAYNSAFRDNFIEHRYLFCWMVSNIRFDSHVPYLLMEAMSEHNSMAGIHPCFESDHRHLWPHNKDFGVHTVPYIEWTAPVVRSDVYARFHLDRQMPYWGMDLDWSYRVREAGYEVGVHRAAYIDHTYIRNNGKPEAITEERKGLRRLSDGTTKRRLIQKYGPDWRDKLWIEKIW